MDNQQEEVRYEVTTSDGEVLSEKEVHYAYTREGRRIVGKEYPNPVPMEPPLGFVPQKPLHEQIRDMVAQQLSQVAHDEGLETAEEADDFDVGDDYDPSSPWELEFEPQSPWPADRPVEAAEAAAIAAVAGEGGAQPPPVEPPAPPAAPSPAKPT